MDIDEEVITWTEEVPCRLILHMSASRRKTAQGIVFPTKIWVEGLLGMQLYQHNTAVTREESDAGRKRFLDQLKVQLKVGR